ncbi:MAG: hypothetical protein G01um101413_158 [Parcubacteria group bacterium Gr01-1014_13]|nr:MAG: hypothetical protein G01um101413_158 [Parcubacteria group bacterium Gr01-1014_13]
MTRFWLKHDLTSEERLEFSNIDIFTCPISERNYIDTDLDFLDPATEDPSLSLADLIDEVAVEKYRIDCGFRTDGVYNHKGAALIAQTREQLYGVPAENPVCLERMIWQEISIRALSVEALRAIYSQFRQGLLKPTEDWEANAKVVVPTKSVEIKDFEMEPPTLANVKKGKYGFDF